MLSEIPTANFIEAGKAAFSILGACITVTCILFLNYYVTTSIENDARNRD